MDIQKRLEATFQLRYLKWAEENEHRCITNESSKSVWYFATVTKQHPTTLQKDQRQSFWKNESEDASWDNKLNVKTNTFKL